MIEELATGVDAMLLDVEFSGARSGLAVGGTGERDAAVVARAPDGGRTWSAVDAGAEGRLYGVAYAGDGTVVAVGYGLVLRSTDGGATWSTIDGPSTTPWLAGVDFRDVRTGFAVGGGPVLWRTDNAGATWRDVTSLLPEACGDHGLRADHFFDQERGTILCDGGRALSTSDGGASWVARRIADENVWVKGLGPASDDAAFAVGSHGTVAFTPDAGATWRRLEFPTHDKLNIAGALDSSTAFVGSMGGKLYATSDAGATWSTIREWPGRALIGVAHRPAEPRELWFSCEGGVLLRIVRAGVR